MSRIQGNTFSSMGRGQYILEKSALECFVGVKTVEGDPFVPP